MKPKSTAVFTGVSILSQTNVIQALQPYLMFVLIILSNVRLCLPVPSLRAYQQNRCTYFSSPRELNSFI